MAHLFGCAYHSNGTKIHLDAALILLSILSVIRHLIWWQQLELASELESSLRDTLGWARNWHVVFNSGKIQLVLCDCSNDTGAVDVKVDGSVLEEKSYFKMLGSLLNWIGGF